MKTCFGHTRCTWCFCLIEAYMIVAVWPLTVFTLDFSLYSSRGGNHFHLSRQCFENSLLKPRKTQVSMRKCMVTIPPHHDVCVYSTTSCCVVLTLLNNLASTVFRSCYLTQGGGDTLQNFARDAWRHEGKNLTQKIKHLENIKIIQK